MNATLYTATIAPYFDHAILDIMVAGHGRALTKPFSGVEDAKRFLSHAFPGIVAEVLDQDDATYEAECHDYANAVLTLTNDGENLYLPDEPRIPALPRGQWLTRPVLLTLKDGRRAYRLDARRAQPLCGISAPVQISEEELRGKFYQTGPLRCPRCLGMHLTAKPVVDTPVLTPREELHCPHCQAGEGNLYVTDKTLSCHLCGYWKSLGNWKTLVGAGTLTDDEIQANEQALAGASVLTVDAIEEESSPYDGQVETGEETEEDPLSELPEHEVHTGDGETMTEHDPDAEADELETVLSRLVTGFWRYRSPLRQGLTAQYMLGKISDERLPLVWMAAAALHADAPYLTETQAAEVVTFLMTASDELLFGLIPGLDEDSQPDLPNPKPMLDKLVWYLQGRASTFRVPRKAAEILAKGVKLPAEAVYAALQRRLPARPQAVVTATV